MKKIPVIILFACAMFASRAQSSDNGTLYLNQSFANESIQNIEAKTSGGSIDVAGGNANNAHIEVYVSANGHHISLTKEEIQARLNEDYDFSVSTANHKLTVIAKPKSSFTNWKKSLNISFRIFVSQNVSTDLSTSGGSISITDLSGTQDFSTSGGSLTVKSISGKITGRTSGGSITVTDSKDEIDLGTSGGSIDATKCNGKIKLHTSGGSVTLTDLNGDISATTSGGSVNGKNIAGELSAHTSGGNITLHELACSLDASTSGGNISVAINNPVKFIKLNNSGGNISIEIPKDKGYDLKLYADRINTSELNNFSGSTKEKEINGKLNGGGIPITADAGGGKISLSFK